MQTDKKEGRKVIHIEVCQDCKIHEWCTHHDEKKYLNNFENVKSAILSALPGCEVVKNEDIVPKIGAFEVTHEGQCLFSKIKSGLWPNPTAFAQRVKAYFDDLAAGKDVSNYGKTTEKAYTRPKKKIDPHSSRYRAFLSTGSQGTLPKTEKNNEPEASKNDKGEEEAGSPGFNPNENEDPETIESPTKNPPVKQENEIKAKPSEEKPKPTEEKPKPKEEEQQVEKQNQIDPEEHHNEQNDDTDQHELQENKDEELPKKENEEEAQQVEEDA